MAHWLHATIDRLLDRRTADGSPAYTVLELLDEPDFLGQVKAQNQRLLGVVCAPASVLACAHLLTASPLSAAVLATLSAPTASAATTPALPEALSEAASRHYSRALVAAELLSLGVRDVRAAVLVHAASALLANFPVRGDVQLSTLCANVLCVLAEQELSTLVPLLNAPEHDAALLLRWLQHVHEAPVARVVGRLLELATPPSRVDDDDAATADADTEAASPRLALLHWLRRHSVVSRLVAALVAPVAPPSPPSPVISGDAAEALLVELVVASAPQHARTTLVTAPLVCELDAPATASALVALLLLVSPPVPLRGHALLSALLLRAARRDAVACSAAACVCDAVRSAVLAALPRLADMLAPVAAASAVSHATVGSRRVRIVEVFVALVRAEAGAGGSAPLSDADTDGTSGGAVGAGGGGEGSVGEAVQRECDAVVTALLDAQCVERALELFFAHPWHNVLHHAVAALVHAALDAASPLLVCRLLQRTRLPERLALAARANAAEVIKARGVRRGYMGHVTALAAAVQSLARRVPQVRNLLDADVAWQRYARGELLETQLTMQEKQGQAQYASRWTAAGDLDFDVPRETRSDDSGSASDAEDADTGEEEREREAAQGSLSDVFEARTLAERGFPELTATPLLYAHVDAALSALEEVYEPARLLGLEASARKSAAALRRARGEERADPGVAQTLRTLRH